MRMMTRLAPFIKRDIKVHSFSLFRLSLPAMWERSEKVTVYEPEGELSQPCWKLDIRFLASRTVGNTFLLFKSLSLWYFMIVAWTENTVSHLVTDGCTTFGSPEELKQSMEGKCTHCFSENMSSKLLDELSML